MEGRALATRIRIEKLSRSWGRFSLRDISLEVKPGEYFVILGPIGSGKTLLLETLAGIHRPASGRIFMDEAEVTGLEPERRNVGLVYQRSMLFPHLDVRGNIGFGLRFQSLSPEEAEERVRTLAGLLGLERLLDRRPVNLSGGEMQKVALARALAVQPRVLLLDEPLAPLDNLSKEELREQLLKLHRQLGTTTLDVTHDQLTARILADRIGVLQEGRLIQIGSVEEVFEKPQTRFVAEFLGMENVFSGRARREGAGARVLVENALEFIVDKPVEGPVGLCIRPERVRITPASASAARGDTEGSGSGSANAVSGRLTDLSDRGPMVRLTVSAGVISIRALMMRPEFRALNLSLGDTVHLLLPPEAIHVFVDNP